MDLTKTQVPVTVSHRTFAKTYFRDLTVRQMVYELKCESALSLAHEAQAPNYAALLEINRIKLINFGSDSFQGKLLGAPFAEVNRHDVAFDLSKWRSLSPTCELLVDTVRNLLLDLGGYLSVSLYQEAMIELLGREEKCRYRLTVLRGDVAMETHPTMLQSVETAFVVTSLARGVTDFLRHTHAIAASMPVNGIKVMIFITTKSSLLL